MCLILIAIGQHPDYPLIIAANRDEFYARPTKSLGWWHDNSKILGGRDLKSGGSWFGISATGQLAAVTNYRDPGSNLPERPSRGGLVLDYLQSSPKNWQEHLKSVKQSYNGFNLLYGHWDKLVWASNRSERSSYLGPGVYGICNSLLDTPWPKVTRGKQLMKQILQQPVSSESLLQMLQDKQTVPDKNLPDTGIGLEWEKRLSSIFICSKTYGTRSSTVLLINRQHEINLVERSWTQAGQYFDKQESLQLA